MKIINLLALGLLFGGGLVQSPALYAADPKPAAEVKEGEKAKEGEKPIEAESRAVPFQGKVSAADPVARTFTISGKTKEKDRVFKVMDNTQILLNNQQSDFKSIAVGELVRGQAYKRAGGWDAKKVMLGPKDEAPAKK